MIAVSSSNHLCPLTFLRKHHDRAAPDCSACPRGFWSPRLLCPHLYASLAVGLFSGSIALLATLAGSIAAPGRLYADVGFIASLVAGFASGALPSAWTAIRGGKERNDRFFPAFCLTPLLMGVAALAYFGIAVLLPVLFALAAFAAGSAYLSPTLHFEYSQRSWTKEGRSYVGWWDVGLVLLYIGGYTQTRWVQAQGVVDPSALLSLLTTVALFISLMALTWPERFFAGLSARKRLGARDALAVLERFDRSDTLRSPALEALQSSDFAWVAMWLCRLFAYPFLLLTFGLNAWAVVPLALSVTFASLATFDPVFIARHPRLVVPSSLLRRVAVLLVFLAVPVGRLPHTVLDAGSRPPAWLVGLFYPLPWLELLAVILPVAVEALQPSRLWPLYTWRLRWTTWIAYAGSAVMGYLASLAMGPQSSAFPLLSAHAGQLLLGEGLWLATLITCLVATFVMLRIPSCLRRGVVRELGNHRGGAKNRSESA